MRIGLIIPFYIDVFFPEVSIRSSELDENGLMGPYKGATDMASRNFLIFQLGDNARIALRPSGTEPKAKAYIEVCSPPCPHGLSDADWQKRCGEVDTTAQKIAEAFLLLCN